MPDSPDLTPDQEEQVRRLLAEARHTEPMPAEVAERLDTVLAGLADEPGREARVVRLAHRRRRAAAMLAAAAAVVVGGVVVGQLLGGSQQSGDAGTAAEDAGTADSGGSQEARPNAAGSDAGAARAARVVRVHPGRFTADVRRLQSERPATAAGSGATGQDRTEVDQDAVEADLCGPGAWGRGRYVAVRYGTSLGYVVLRRPRGDTQVADLFLCGSDEAVRSVTLPAP